VPAAFATPALRDHRILGVIENLRFGHDNRDSDAGMCAIQPEKIPFPCRMTVIFLTP
jgi:hypothetical protein